LVEWGSAKGWSRHQHFGLRKEWLDFYFTDRHGWRNQSFLGNRQVDSLAMWIRTAGIDDAHGRLTPLGQAFLAKGTGFLPLWELLWVNVVFSFPTARWYAHLGQGEWTTTELKLLLRKEAVRRLSGWTASNAIMELAGLLECTPVGAELQQGRVILGSPRRLVRAGTEPSDQALLHAVRWLCKEEGPGTIPWDRDQTWPWVIFGCERRSIMLRLAGINQNWFIVDEKGLTVTIQTRGVGNVAL